ncbi:hypothetical protein GIB67_022702 [Kingdonia uniflora]|uniref:Uncharacterized protein n=1 Tax=Kingdonia uniflora TaxID=39325 RepID=A0A7J7P8N3_9MAGN|nr:hypothetical protein GIB67_022702 [Kingdonia uniflora]
MSRSHRENVVLPLLPSEHVHGQKSAEGDGHTAVWSDKIGNSGDVAMLRGGACRSAESDTWDPSLPSLTILDNLLLKFCTMKNAFDHVAKKQRLSSSKIQKVNDQITREINEALVKIQFLAVDKEAILSNLNNELNMMSLLHQIEGLQKDLDAGLSLLDLSDSFISETINTKLTITLSALFYEMYQVLEAMKCKNLEPTLNWGTAIK